MMPVPTQPIRHIIPSKQLLRDVIIDCYLPNTASTKNNCTLLILNDGQDLSKMNFNQIIKHYEQEHVNDFFVAGVHCSENRVDEYGTAKRLDFKGRGKLSGKYQSFLMMELLPFLKQEYASFTFTCKAIGGFSLGGLSAIDTIWNHPDIFQVCGVFSGSLWWRDKDHLATDFREASNRIMHQLIRNGPAKKGLKFFFEAGQLDETADRNNNGIIDSIDDTIDLIKELELKGYSTTEDIYYMELADGRHDIETWGRALPVFLLWAQQQIN